MIDLATDALAAYRLTRLINEDTIAAPLRSRIDEWALRPVEWRSWLAGSPKRLRAPWVSDFVRCPWCVSIWMALGVGIFRRFLPGWSTLARALALSAVAGLLSESHSNGTSHG